MQSFHGAAQPNIVDEGGPPESKRIRPADDCSRIFVSAGSYFYELLRMVQHADWMLSMVVKSSVTSALDAKNKPCGTIDFVQYLTELFYKKGVKQNLEDADLSTFGIRDHTPWVDVFDEFCRNTVARVSIEKD
jgi:hypothetical protein